MINFKVQKSDSYQLIKQISQKYCLNKRQQSFIKIISSQKRPSFQQSQPILMTTQINEEQFINQCAKGNVQLAQKRFKKDNIDINCKQKQSLNTAAHVAAMNDQLEVLRMLATNNFNFRAGQDFKNAQGNTPLHLACERPNLQIILFLVLQGSDTTIKNNKGSKPGESQIDARIFLSSCLIPEEKAFNAFSQDQKKKLQQIFEDIDFDDLKAIDFHKAVRFNKYIEQSISEAKAEKDANDFLKSTAICNKHSVNVDQWIFAFSKLYICDPDEFNKFIEDYDKAVAVQGKLKSINI